MVSYHKSKNGSDHRCVKYLGKYIFSLKDHSIKPKCLKYHRKENNFTKKIILYLTQMFNYTCNLQISLPDHQTLLQKIIKYAGTTTVECFLKLFQFLLFYMFVLSFDGIFFNFLVDNNTNHLSGTLVI